MRVGALELKLRLACGDAYAFGPGKADLLAAVGREGSISAAGRALGMSYRRAWLLVDEVNRCFREPLVAAVPGGAPGRGARLTPTGEAVLAAYRRLEAAAAEAAGTEAYRLVADALRDGPAPRRAGSVKAATR